MNRIAICLGVVALTVFPAVADEVRPQSSIQSVTVYPQGASVTRRVPATLPAGASAVLIDDLPANIEADSLKVEGSADATIEIGSVETRPAPADAVKDPKRQAFLDEIQALTDRLGGINDRLAALDGRRTFVEHLIEATPSGFGKALGQSGDGIERWSAAAETIGNELAAIADAAGALRLEGRSVQTRIDEANKALAALPAPRDHVIARVELQATAAANGVLLISYRVPDAAWAPAYDAMLKTDESGGKPAITVIRRAEVTQATGEDWANVALTLSTARPSRGTAAPELAPLLVAFATEQPVSESAPRAAGKVEGRAPVPPAMLDAAAGGASADRPVAIAQAVADFGDFRAEYKVPGLVSVESGVGARGLRVATDEGMAELEVRAVPSLSDAAYLQARFVALSGAPFLAGKVSLFRDGAYVGSGALAFTNAGKPLELGFGVDDLVHVTRTALDRATAEHGILSSRRTDTRRFRITVENLHRQKMAITVYDRTPYAEDEKITVVRLPDATAPTAENVDDRRGVLAWRYDYAPGESRDIQNAYEVSWPASESVVLDD
jgi:uncharacterized protein (TIGR02231 family)